MRNKRLAALVAVAVSVSALMLSSCGDSSDGADATSANAAGKPLEFFAINDGVGGVQESHNAGVAAAIGEINAAGGIDGRPLKLTKRYVTNFDPNIAAKNTREAIADPDNLAMVDTVTSSGSVLVPLLKQAGMASIGTSAGDAAFAAAFGQDFPTATGGLAIVASAASAVVTLGAKHLGLIYLNLPSVAPLVDIVKNDIIGPRGADLKTAVPIEATATDVNSVVAKAIEGNPDALVLATAGDQTATIVRSARQLGYTNPVIVSGTTSANDIKTKYGSATGNVYVVGNYNPDSDGYRQYLAAMAKYAPDYADLDEGPAGAYLAVKVFAAAVKAAKEPTRKGILESLKSMSAFDTDEMTPVLDFTKPQTAVNGAFAAFSNLTVTLHGKYDNGKILPVAGVKPFTPIFP